MEQTKFNKSFFDKVESIRIKDPLAIALGAMDKNEAFVFTYTDAVKLARPFMSGRFLAHTN